MTVSSPADLPAALTDLDWEKGDGLLPAIVQDARNATVLMLGYMNEAALRATLKSGLVTFYSRSRTQLWQKGETSGNTLKLVSVCTDCDRDTLLVLAEPAGPTCHLGRVSCFGDETFGGAAWLGELEGIIKARTGADPQQSYTAKLLNGPIDRAAQKVGEEGVEVALAAMKEDPGELSEEAADLLYHLLVVLRAKGVPFSQVMAVLRSRHDQD